MAGRIKATYSISLADAYIAALSQHLSGILVHKDPEFEKLSLLIKDYKLPFKTS
jgi:predicted nucleic acid-binding protein